MSDVDRFRAAAHAALLMVAATGAACGSSDGEALEPTTFPTLPQVSANDGAVLRDLTLVTITTEGDPLAADLAAFGEALPKTGWWLTLAGELDLGAPPRAVHRAGPAIATDVDSAAIERYIMSAVARSAGPFPDGRTLYLLYLPPGVHHVDAGSGEPNIDCDALSGFHGTLGDGGDAWGFVQRCPPPSGESQLEHVTLIASARIVEAATNPTGRGYSLGMAPVDQPWALSVWRSYEQRGHVELADLCKGARIVEGGYLLARYWSNAAAATPGADPCAPTVAEPYFNVGVAQEWYAVEPGRHVTVPLVGWSNQERGDWVVAASVKHASEGGWSAQVTTKRMRGEGGVINHGGAGQLHVAAPAEAKPGSYAVVLIRSEDITSTGAPEAGRDRFHARPVGIYVAP